MILQKQYSASNTLLSRSEDSVVNTSSGSSGSDSSDVTMTDVMATPEPVQKRTASGGYPTPKRLCVESEKEPVS